jgi:prepilin-type N-terminal cleavage/methylation domain-containing protein
MTRKRPQVRGFTLVEILIVVVILGIVSAVVVPQIGSRADLRAAAGARVVMSDLLYAQNLAISTQQRMYVRFGSNTYSLYTTATGGSPITHPVQKTPFTVNFGASAAPALQSCTIPGRSFDGNATLMFDELGTPYSYNTSTSATAPLSNAGTISVRSGTFTLTVRVEPFTGEISVN